jgi:glyoxylase-like metal-dependent hydrolase (beta-lactamase superfamily II)
VSHPHLPVADDWFSVERLGEGITRLNEPFVHALLNANLFLVEGRDRDLLVDSGNGLGDLGRILDTLRHNRAQPLVLVVTHCHQDHVGGAHSFSERLSHPLATPEHDHPTLVKPLMADNCPPEVHEAMAADGLPLPPVLISALPRAGFEPEAFDITWAPPTGLLEEGDVVDLGDRVFSVLHLPGHSPGSIGLLEARTGIFFSGDAVYEGNLLDGLPGSDVPDFLETMRRLRELPLQTVHPGHDESFGVARLRQICGDYLDGAYRR